MKKLLKKKLFCSLFLAASVSLSTALSIVYLNTKTNDGDPTTDDKTLEAITKIDIDSVLPKDTDIGKIHVAKETDNPTQNQIINAITIKLGIDEIDWHPNQATVDFNKTNATETIKIKPQSWSPNYTTTSETTVTYTKDYFSPVALVYEFTGQTTPTFVNLNDLKQETISKLTQDQIDLMTGEAGKNFLLKWLNTADMYNDLFYINQITVSKPLVYNQPNGRYEFELKPKTGSNVYTSDSIPVYFSGSKIDINTHPDLKKSLGTFPVELSNLEVYAKFLDLNKWIQADLLPFEDLSFDAPRPGKYAFTVSETNKYYETSAILEGDYIIQSKVDIATLIPNTNLGQQVVPFKDIVDLWFGIKQVNPAFELPMNEVNVQINQIDATLTAKAGSFLYSGTVKVTWTLDEIEIKNINHVVSTTSDIYIDQSTIIAEAEISNFNPALTAKFITPEGVEITTFKFDKAELKPSTEKTYQIYATSSLASAISYKIKFILDGKDVATSTENTATFKENATFSNFVINKTEMLSGETKSSFITFDASGYSSQGTFTGKITRVGYDTNPTSVEWNVHEAWKEFEVEKTSLGTSNIKFNLTPSSMLACKDNPMTYTVDVSISYTNSEGVKKEIKKFSNEEIQLSANSDDKYIKENFYYELDTTNKYLKFYTPIDDVGMEDRFTDLIIKDKWLLSDGFEYTTIQIGKETDPRATMSNSSFFGMENLEKVVIKSTTAKLQAQTFGGCPKIKSITATGGAFNVKQFFNGGTLVGEAIYSTASGESDFNVVSREHSNESDTVDTYATSLMWGEVTLKSAPSNQAADKTFFNNCYSLTSLKFDAITSFSGQGGSVLGPTVRIRFNESLKTIVFPKTLTIFGSTLATASGWAPILQNDSLEQIVFEHDEIFNTSTKAWLLNFMVGTGLYITISDPNNQKWKITVPSEAAKQNWLTAINDSSKTWEAKMSERLQVKQ